VLFERHKRLLSLLDALGGEVGHLDFQKLLFLYCRETEATPTYEFVPYKFGAFSFTSYDDKRKLVAQGLIEEQDRTWKLTAEGRKAATVPPLTRMRMDKFARRNAELRGEALVAEAYRRHPFYAVRSEISERVLNGDPLALMAIAAAKPPARKPGVVTIGYEGRTLEAFLNHLLHASVTVLCDVRRNAFSRKYGFSKATLQRGCEGVGIRYEHLPQLGIASDERRGLDTQTDYDALFDRYERETLPRQSNALEKIREWVDSRHRVALTCFELLPQQCHRHCVADELARRFGEDWKPQHL
jgi:hypothetical protein